MKELLIQGAKEMHIALNDAQASALIHYLELIIKWNKTYNLSAIRTMEVGVKKHLLDSLSIVPFIDQSPLLDVGSGAGLPGIVLSIMKPDLAVSVLDTVGKKCRFMQFVKSQLALKNLSVINARVEAFNPQQCFGQITSRAFAEVDKTLNLTQHLLCDNGHYLLMKGANAKQETPPKEAEIYQLSVPWVSDQRFLIKMKPLHKYE
ncbi:16S rRNA (guanine(527)-N(7))-methyltransferase (EC [Bathymodiolus thermophilus thioautotrophic gill symbiont]|uniref:Ribosomal RNA small subunit methyltransferase G n=2 Tax=Bathymodiolus thermophilus thioautotrophic gill symbiont TaxID=2360 RepID=A0A1J5UGE0_9GAMM|nr:16S rRNA (guanine(527)-N(7))-methyltransferase RsmG [Bathymodiolus thermophilus thioautotrophic gill symbiont]AYQ57735.1 Ribosomal RNA small subunit methyltransferase G [Bathymodiolus thermophilus thioautotrophic gill symbiont]OIR24989.1 16S rRNA (guanine(527)-N(7))-methyltransferase RsmG [Bathymodiolus thermophilus thioautotrophic gill symbiont]CAB5505461.1 16S rRNA (guanine(527)-N(7))-methyltransferase (EC [Bathymodiolus thermophilus thioautotrophic gill symbiont]